VRAGRPPDGCEARGREDGRTGAAEAREGWTSPRPSSDEDGLLAGRGGRERRSPAPPLARSPLSLSFTSPNRIGGVNHLHAVVVVPRPPPSLQSPIGTQIHEYRAGRPRMPPGKPSTSGDAAYKSKSRPNLVPWRGRWSPHGRPARSFPSWRTRPRCGPAQSETEKSAASTDVGQ